MSKISHTREIISSVRKETDRAVLFYSVNGKDSIVLLDMLSREFKEVICYFMYFVKGLDHIESRIESNLKKYPNVTIKQIPHFLLSNVRRSGVFCEPDPNTKIVKMKEIETMIREETGEKYIFSGMKGVDGFMKRMRLKMFGDNFTTETGNVYPLALWTNAEVLKYIQVNGLPKPVDYSIPEHVTYDKSGRVRSKVSNGITFDLDVFLFLRKYYPNDLKKILKEFPLSEQILFRYDNKK
nr:phosphoadenosine phosphosulfate reductase family protein [uncultured Bacteroides sp.]